MKTLFATGLLTVLLTSLAAGQEELLTQVREARSAGNHARVVQLIGAALEGDDIDALLASPELLRGYADAFYNLGEAGKAVTWAAKAVTLEPGNLEGQRIAALAFYWYAEAAKSDPGATSGKINGLYEESLAFLDDGLKLAPADEELLTLRAHTLYWLERHEESALAFALARKVAEDPAAMIPFEIREWRLAGQPDKALAIVESGLKQKPTAWLQAQKAGLLLALKDEAGALQAWKAALGRSDLDAQTAGEISTGIWNVLGSGKRYGEALELVKAWTAGSHQDANALWWRGYYRRLLEQDADAAKDFMESYQVSGKTLASAAMEAAWAFQRLGQADRALEWFVKAGETPWNWGHPDNSPARQMAALANSLNGSGKSKEAIGILEQHALKASPDDWVVLNLLGWLYRDLGGAQRGAKGRELCRKSADYYERACEAVQADTTATDTNRAGVLNDTGVLFHFPQYQIDDVAKGVEYYRRALSCDGTYKDALENLGLCLNLLGKYEEAVPLFEKVLAQEPGRRVSMGGLAAARKALGK